MVSERLGVCSVHGGVVIDAVEEHRGLDDVAQVSALGFDQGGEVRNGLTDLRIESVDECAVDETELA